MKTKFDVFADTLEKDLKQRYDLCEDFRATPSGILLAVLNAVAGARQVADQWENQNHK